MWRYARYLTLSTPRQRLIAWLVLTVIIFTVPYAWLENLSLYKRIGIESAPSIGLTRSYWLILHGDISAAWERNRLIFAVLAIGIPLLAKDAYALLRQLRKTTD